MQENENEIKNDDSIVEKSENEKALEKENENLKSQIDKLNDDISFYKKMLLTGKPIETSETEQKINNVLNAIKNLRR